MGRLREKRRKEMIKSRRELAIALENGGSVNMKNVSKALGRVVALWAKRNEIIVSDGKITGNF